MAGQRAAIRYAKALLSLAQQNNSVDAVQEDLQSIIKTIADSKELQLMLKSPIVKTEVKLASLKEIFTNITNEVLGLFTVLAENKRLPLLNTVAVQYNTVYQELKGNTEATVTTAVPLSGKLEEKVIAKLKEITGKNVTITNVIDTNIIGGFILRVGDMQYNASVTAQLNKLEREFTNNLYVS